MYTPESHTAASFFISNTAETITFSYTEIALSSSLPLTTTACAMRTVGSAATVAVAAAVAAASRAARRSPSAPWNATSPTTAESTHDVYFDVTCTSRGSLRRQLYSYSSAPSLPNLPTHITLGGPRSRASTTRATSSADTTRMSCGMPHSVAPLPERTAPAPSARSEPLAATAPRPRFVVASAWHGCSATPTSARRTSSASCANGLAGSSARERIPRSEPFNTERIDVASFAIDSGSTHVATSRD